MLYCYATSVDTEWLEMLRGSFGAALNSEAKAQMHCLGEAIYFGRAVSTDSPDIQKLAEPPIDLW